MLIFAAAAQRKNGQAICSAQDNGEQRDLTSSCQSKAPVNELTGEHHSDS